MSLAAFQILSDLHLETQASSYNWHFKQTAPNLALLGDIGQVADDGFFRFLQHQLGRYWHVFLLLGNHEPLSGSWAAAKQKMRDFAEQTEQLRAQSTIGRFILLDQTRYDISDTLTILGCTLFSRVSREQAAAVSSRFVDFRQIQHWTVEDHVDAHLSDLRWLNTQVSQIARTEPQRQIAIFTHHSPSLDPRAVDPQHAESTVMSGFATDLRSEACWSNASVVVWSFGHTHFNCDFTDELGKRLVANQKGYATAPALGFDAERVFLVGTDRRSGGSSMLLV